MASSNYIKSLEAAVTSRDREIVALNRGINDLFAYLTSDKFSNDPTVQVQDVMNRLREARSAANSAALEA